MYQGISQLRCQMAGEHPLVVQSTGLQVEQHSMAAQMVRQHLMVEQIAQERSPMIERR
jgi:hypothetical protein